MDLRPGPDLLGTGSGWRTFVDGPQSAGICVEVCDGYAIEFFVGATYLRES